MKRRTRNIRGIQHLYKCCILLAAIVALLTIALVFAFVKILNLTKANTQTEVSVTPAVYTEVTEISPNEELHFIRREYTVRAGDTFSALAENVALEYSVPYTVALSTLKGMNPDINPDIIHVGDIIYIPQLDQDGGEY
jgi:LysM domain protein|nr:MAG TPA: LysM [Caudoviricetes sp.]